jgi:type IV secretion system protein VirB9
MNRFALPILMLLAACGGKAGTAPTPPPPADTMLEARLVPDAPPAAVEAEPLVLAASEPLVLPAPSVPRPAGPPLARVAAANRAAVREPSREAYLNAAQVYDWTEGVLYRLYTAPERVSDIALEPGEALVSVAAGDTVRWVIGDTESGTGTSRRTHVLVKPSVAGLSTNLVIATDRRVYHLVLESTEGAAMASVAWSYPRNALKVLDRAAGNAPQALVPGMAGGQVVGGVDLERLEFGYAIEGDTPPWRPLRAFDDGAQVFIEFPDGLAQGEAPPLFVSGEGGTAELINYRLRGRYYVVDRLFAVAELRLGERRQQVVRIVRTDGGRRGDGR